MQKWLTLLISFILIFSTFVIIPTVKAPSTFPIVVTSDATGVGETNAILHGRLMDDGGELCTVWFQYGLTVDNWTVTKEEGLKSGDLFFFDATGLESGKLYHYQACAGNSFGKVTGEDKTFLTTSNIKEEPYTYWQADENGGFSHWEVNKTFYRNWLNNTITWKVEQSIDNNIWVDYKKFEVKKDWDEKTLSEKHTVIVSSDKDAYYRILTNTVSSSDLVSYEDCSIKAIGEKSNDFRLTYKISDDKDYILMYNWDDYLNSSIASTSTFNKQIKSDILSKQLFEWSVVSNIKIKSGDSFILDPTYGLIGDAVTSTYEYDAQEGRYPDMIRLGTSEYYAIVSTGDSGTELDGYIRTIKVWNDNGTIKTALIDSLEYDTTDGRYPSIVNVGTDMYAILYGDTGTYFFVVTVSIDDADGLIAAAVTETLQLTYSPDLVYISHPRIIYVTGNVYAVIYEQSSNYIYMQTLNITSAGDIGAAVADSQRLEATAKASLPGNLCLVDSNTVAVVYDSGAVDGNDGYMTTWNISSTGDITNTYADFWEFDTSKGGTPYIAKVSGTTYMIAYEDTNADLYVKTCTIADTGMITKSWLDTQAINITNGDYPTFFNVSTNGTNQWIKGITFSGEGSDGYVSTFDVTSAGIINSVIDTLEVTAADTINWYQPACWVSGNYYLLITEDGVFDGWAKTFTIETYVYNNTAPLITANSQNPSNASTAVGLSLSGNYSHFNISVTDIDDATDNMNITWSTNESGAWLTMGTNASVSDGTYWCTNVSWVDSYSTKYWWNVSVNDGMGGFDNETYNFTTNAIPTITGEIPLNNSIDISLNPVCNVTVNDVDPNTLDVTFASNYSNGVDWVNYQTNSSVATGSNISWVFSDASTGGTAYWWRVYCDDIMINISATYSFETASNFTNGDGTEGNPFQITNCAELNWTRDNLSAYYILMNDIDLGACGVTGWNGGEGFIPIDRRVWDDGEEEWVITPFSGSFDGQNYTIGNLYINNVSMNYMGLFGYVQYSVIENLGLININITGGEPIGGLIGSNGGIVNNCNVAGSVNTTGTGGGGVVGENYGNFTDCHSMVIVNGGDQIGGFVGANSGIIINCSSTGSIIGTSNYFSGGFVGYNQYSELTETGEIYNSSATGNVTGDTYVGGFVGRGEGLIINCYATGNVTGDTDVGGFVGRLGYFSTDGTITNCYSIGNIIGDINVGGLIGTDDNGIITNCYWDNETSGQTTSDGGEGRTTAQMTYDYEGYDPPCIGLYEDWDLDTNTSGSSIWVHDDTSQNDGYPLFRWQYSGLPTIIMDINRTSFGFGIIQKDTVVYSNQTADTFRIYNNGTCDIDIDINGTNFTGDGVSDWVLSGTNGDNMIKMEIYNSTTDWFQINLTEDTWVTNMLAGTSMTANIGLTTPIIFYSGKPMSATVYMTASIH
jgi:hypothetical protein